MNRFLKIGLITLLVAGALGGAGCKTRPKNITAIPGSEGRGGASTELVPGGPIVNSGPGANAAPIRNTGPGPGSRFAPNEREVTGIDNNPPGGFNPGGNTLNPNPPVQTQLGEGTIRDNMREDREMFRGNTIYFEYDKSAVKKGPEATKLIAVAEYLKGHAGQGHKLVIEGHCDERGTEGYNLALGERRALSVREVLLNNGVAAENVTTESYGEARPANPGHDEGAWSKNRRAEFILLVPVNAVR